MKHTILRAMTEATSIPAKTGNIIQVFLSWRGRMYVIKMFFPSVAQPSRSDVQDQLDKVYQDQKFSHIKSPKLNQENAIPADRRN